MFSDLTHDAAPLGTTTGEPPSSATSCSPPSPLSCPSDNDGRPVTGAFKTPEVIHITGSKGVQIGPVYNISSPIVQTTPSQQQSSREDQQPDPRPPREHVLQMLQITREISESDKALIGEHLGDQWRQLGREMDYSSGQLDNIDNDHRRLQDKIYELLTMWHDKESSAATVAQLTRLLMRIRAFEVFKRFHRTLNL
uniref:Ankyrin-2-like n=2 Tax=Hirondellea gigas TaxID=1518452 RepID=A0A2P2HX58_9CRUS